MLIIYNNLILQLWNALYFVQQFIISAHLLYTNS